MNSFRSVSQLFILFFLLVLLNECTLKTSDPEKDIEEAESEFAEMASEKGIPEAFTYFADDNAVILRNNMIIRGKDSIRLWFSEQSFSNVSLQWKPDFIEISKSGDLAYTYGKYIYTTIDSSGKEISSNGVFHTVWKKQPDGSWKYVWD